MLLLAACAPHTQASDALVFDLTGRVRAVIDWPRESFLRGEAWIVGPGWKTIVRQDSLIDAKRSAGKDGDFTREGHTEVDGRRVDLSESVHGQTITYRTLAPDADVAVEGVYWLANVPIDEFKGGTATIGTKSIRLEPAISPDRRFLGDATVDSLALRTADGRTTIEIRFDRAVRIRAQDVTSFGDKSFQLYAAIIEGKLARGVAASLAVSINTTIAPDTTDVTVTVDPAGGRTRFDGFGGNFVYGADSPVTRTTLNALRLTWARIPLELREWEPNNDNGDATRTDIQQLAARDTAESKLRKRFELDRELFKRSQGRLIASVWYLPEWLFAEPLQAGAWRDSAGVVPRQRWPELAECIVSYLSYAKEKYGIEPQLFSFNESEIGVYVKLDRDELHDLAKLLKSSFAAAGLKTKLLLGDSADLELGLKQIEPTLADDEARGFVGALAYHPWAGQNDQWPKWAEVAEKHHLPLLVTEMGADANAWQDGSYATPIYALRLAKRYVEQLSTGRAQALLEWEWSDDFPLAALTNGKWTLSPRGQWLQQITQRSPQFGELISTTTDRPSLLAAAIAREGGEGRDDAWTLHLVNLDAERKVKIVGLPARVEQLSLSVVDPIEGARAGRTIRVKHGECELQLPAAAMATLSTQHE